MHKPTVVAACIVMLTSMAIAQNNLETKWHCAKPTSQQAYQVPDMSGRSYAASQGSCSATSSKTGEKSGTYTEAIDNTKVSLNNHGNFVVTMEDGGKIFYSYSGTATPAKKTGSNKWKILGGTGKYKAAKGAGTCAGTLNDDESSDWDCTGTFTAGGQ
jgi:hypothetical protein